MTDSDDSSAASSGDELLDFVAPGTQQSKDSSPEKSTASESVELTEVVVNAVAEAATDPLAASRKRKREEDGGEATDDDVQILIEQAFKKCYDGVKIGSLDKLFWLEKSERSTKKVYAVRIPSPDETVGLHFRKYDESKQCKVQYIQYPHDSKNAARGRYDLAGVKSLTPYHGGKEEQSAWCPALFERYAKQLKKDKVDSLGLKKEYLFLQRILKEAECEEREKKRAKELEDIPAEIETKAICPKETELEDAAEAEESEDETEDMWSRKRDPLRAGDVIGFYEQQAKIRDETYRTYKVVAVNPKARTAGGRILTLDDPLIVLGPDHQVKIVQRMIRGKLQDHNGTFRPLEEYSLRKSGGPDAAAKLMAQAAQRNKDIIKRKQDEMIAKAKADGFCPEDMIR
mmetsp:Transcript_13491/g.30974  ORF Transcript_13491/g.30974 Transcript_13491/m.30974 type:complete len:401 (-) Transcript_13491:95-1297(-)